MGVEEIVLRIDGKPFGKQRARVNTRTRRAYTPKPTLRAEAFARVAWMQAGCPRLRDDAVEMEVEMVLRRPADHWLVDGSLSAAGRRSPHPRVKPDFDNAVKLICDALNGAAYKDDVDISRSTQEKRWAARDEPEHTRIVIRTRTPPPLEAP